MPFTLLLSRDLKRIKSRLAVVCCIMIFARCWDMWWLIEPNFPDARAEPALQRRHSRICRAAGSADGLLDGVLLLPN